VTGVPGPGRLAALDILKRKAAAALGSAEVCAGGSAWIERWVPNPNVVGSNPTRRAIPLPTMTSAPRKRPAAPTRRGTYRPARSEYRGRTRFTRAGDYESQREWRRYEGTPQRELLRTVRERFLQRALGEVRAGRGLVVEVGPGPGRFTPLLEASADRLVLLDLSRRMLDESLGRSGRERRGGRPADGVLGDAARVPLRGEIARVVVALGNIVGFAGDRSLGALQEVAGLVAPGGVLVVETVAHRTGTPKFLRHTRPEAWPALLRQDPTRHLARQLAAGLDPCASAPSSGGVEGGDFQFLAADAVVRFLNREGFEIRDQMIAAPLTGGDPDLVGSIIAQHRGHLGPLLRWEECAGRFPSILSAGGHTLTAAVAT
jgi:SAM-dependent methyltransferase